MDQNKSQNRGGTGTSTGYNCSISNAADSIRKSIEEPKEATIAASSSSTSTRKYIRSYTCTFCEKGFSNAQALGGHMNIHRRDRARLRNAHDPLSESRSKDDASLPMTINWHLHHQRPISNHDRNHDHQVLQLFDDNQPPAPELDLELRLGPRQTSSPSSQ